MLHQTCRLILPLAVIVLSSHPAVVTRTLMPPHPAYGPAVAICKFADPTSASMTYGARSHL